MTTTNMTAIARPYATAAFEFALAHQALPSWEALLAAAAQCVEQKDMEKLLTSPDITRAQLTELFNTLLASLLDDQEKKNFIALLAEKKRLPLLPEIAELFAAYRAEKEKTAMVQVISAVALDDNDKQKFTKKLTERLQRHVSLHYDVDPSLLGGAIVRVGDNVIDGSVRGKLNRLLDTL